ncbi:MAG TPA: hypothetical protein VGI57_03715 [Usitatibacter sp.]
MSPLHLAATAAALLFIALPASAQISLDSAPKPQPASAGSPATVAYVQQALAAIAASVSKPGNDYAADAQRLKNAREAQVATFLKTRDAEWKAIEIATVEQIRQYNALKTVGAPIPAALLEAPKVQASFAEGTRAGLEKIRQPQAQEDAALKAQYIKSANAAIALAVQDVRKLQLEVTRQNPPNLQDLLALLANYANSLQLLWEKINNS